MSNQSVARQDFTAPLVLVPKAKKAKDTRPELPKGLGLYYRGSSPVIQWRKVIDGEEYFRSTEETKVDRAIRKANKFDTEARDTVNGWTKVTVPTLKAFFKDYCTRLSKARQAFIWQLAPFVERYGDLRVDKVTQFIAKGWLTERQNPDLHRSIRGTAFAPGTVRAEGSILRTMFSDAKLQGFIKTNPFSGDKRSGFKHPKASVRRRVLKAGYEQERFLDVLDRHQRRAVLFVLSTGVRLEEFTLLVPDDIIRTADGRGKLVIRAEIAKGKKARTIPFGPEVLRLVDEQLQYQGIEAHSTVDLVWHIGYYAFENLVKEAAVEAGIPRLTPHDLRRTFGTRMAGHVRNPKHLQLLMGHESIRTTMEHYNHVEEDEIDGAVAGVDLGLGLT